MGRSMWNLKNIDREIENSPNAILVEQSNFFEKETKNVLYAKINNVILSKEIKFEYKLATNFSIVATGLDNYTYTIFTVYSNPESNYPLAITVNNNKEDTIDSGFEPNYKCENQEQFIDALTKILSSEEVTEIIHILYSKSKNY